MLGQQALRGRVQKLAGIRLGLANDVQCFFWATFVVVKHLLQIAKVLRYFGIVNTG